MQYGITSDWITHSYIIVFNNYVMMALTVNLILHEHETP